VDQAPGSGTQRNVGSVVLVVDDEPIVLRATARLLESEGYIVHQASDETEALDCMKRLATQPDLVVMDLWMSPRTGADLAERMIAEGVASRFLFMTASPGGHDPLPGPLLEKPFSAERLLETVAHLLAR
jgi:two-component system cell cycle sensor histidine kinase/response regulator CckA